mmetsp:Transcript_47338/g.113613  ORF Transcript_47338/g.113613 Transcript_47338/m.113613 type:complete len:212 (-) Transcript_47338:302-937(-)
MRQLQRRHGLHSLHAVGLRVTRELGRAEERAAGYPAVVVERGERRLHRRVELAHVLPLHRVYAVAVAQPRVVRRAAARHAAVPPAVAPLAVAPPLVCRPRRTAPLAARAALVPARITRGVGMLRGDVSRVARGRHSDHPVSTHPVVLGRPQPRPLPHAVRRLVLVAAAVVAVVAVVAGGVVPAREAILRASALADDLSPDHRPQHRLDLTE